MNEADYHGVRASIETEFDGVKTPLKIDISTGDVITPREVKYSFNLMFEERSIAVLAYNLETVIAEKLETLISRNIANTRMRDFYDIHILYKLYGDTLNIKILKEALYATAGKRKTECYLEDAEEIFDEVQQDLRMQNLWKAYQNKFSYALDIPWKMVMESVREIYRMTEN